VAWYIDSRQRDGGKPTLELDVSFSFLSLLCLLVTGLDDVAEHLLDVLNGVGFSQLYRMYRISLVKNCYIFGVL